MDIDHGDIVIGEESIIFRQDINNEVCLRHSEMDTLIETYLKYKEQQSVNKSVKSYLSKRVNPDAAGNTSYLYD